MALGERYHHGEYAEKNVEKAIYYYNLAAEQGNSKLGSIYLQKVK